jgi:predicted phosphoribosyltransferase
MIFKDRKDAGKKLAVKLKKYKKENVLILALPRGGVPVGYEIANFLHTPLDVLVVRKIGAPHNPELAIGAIASGGIWFLDKLTIQRLHITPEEIEKIAKEEIIEVIRRQKEYRDDLPPPKITGKIIILVDDGIATGATTRAAIRAIQKQRPMKLVLAVPVCSAEVAKELKPLVDEFICLETPVYFEAVGAHYQNFPQVTDEEVKTLLKKNKI